MTEPEHEHIYCLVLCNDGRYLALNRDYEPWGTGITAWVDYQTCPGMRVQLTEDQLTKLTKEGWSRARVFGTERAWLYRTNPDRSKAQHMAATIRDAVIWGLADLQEWMRAEGCEGDIETDIISGWDEAEDS